MDKNLPAVLSLHPIQPLETLFVPATGTSVSSVLRLAKNETYGLVISGVVQWRREVFGWIRYVDAGYRADDKGAFRDEIDIHRDAHLYIDGFGPVTKGQNLNKQNLTHTYGYLFCRPIAGPLAARVQRADDAERMAGGFAIQIVKHADFTRYVSQHTVTEIDDEVGIREIVVERPITRVVARTPTTRVVARRVVSAEIDYPSPPPPPPSPPPRPKETPEEFRARKVRRVERETDDKLALIEAMLKAENKASERIGALLDSFKLSPADRRKLEDAIKTLWEGGKKNDAFKKF